MKKNVSVLLGLVLAILTTKVTANTACTGEVRIVMDRPPYCEGKIAIMFESTTVNGKWVCTLSSKSESMAIAAVASGQKMTAVFDDSIVNDCSTASSHYLVPEYIYYRNDQ